MKTALKYALTAVLFSVCLAVSWDEGDYGDDSYVVRKRYLSPSCQRCFRRPSDWSSCSNCYGRGPTPYYGYAKRDYDSTDFSDDDDIYTQKRGSYISCRCCLSLGKAECCKKCPGVTPYYEPAPVNRCDTCCKPNSFDLGCCLECSSKKRK